MVMITCSAADLYWLKVSNIILVKILP